MTYSNILLCINAFSSRCTSTLITLFTYLLLSTNSHAQVEPMAPTKQVARFEINFMTEMIDHHHMAVMMSELCQEKAFHDALLAKCGDMKTAQQQEIDTLQAWLKAWYGKDHAPTMTPKEMQELETMAALPAEAFEVKFMKTMIPHHGEAITKSLQCMMRAFHSELISMCESIIAMQAEEIRLFRTWLCEWYGRCIIFSHGRKFDA